MNPKKVSESAIDNQLYPLFVNDLNINNTAFGGRVLEIADKLAAAVAMRHSNRVCVTFLVDSVKFLAPAVQGECLIFKAAVNRVWNSSMEVGVKVMAENFQTGAKRHVVSAYFTFVAIDESRRPVPVAPVMPEMNDEKRRYQKAEDRRRRRLEDLRR